MAFSDRVGVEFGVAVLQMRGERIPVTEQIRARLSQAGLRQDTGLQRADEPFLSTHGGCLCRRRQADPAWLPRQSPGGPLRLSPRAKRRVGQALPSRKCRLRQPA